GGLCSFCGTTVSDSARCWTVAVDAVAAGAHDRDVFAGNFLGAGQGKLLIAAPGTAVRHFHGHFPAGDQADSRNTFTKLAQAFEQVVGGAVVVPVIATVVDFDREAVGNGCDACFVNCGLVGE